MIYNITKKYYSVQQAENNNIQINGRKVTTELPFFESDILQEVIDNFISNDILSFDIPVEVIKPLNVPNYYLNKVYSDQILTKYVDVIAIYEDKILTSFVEMSQEEKLTIGLERKLKSLKWIHPQYNVRLTVRKDDTYATSDPNTGLLSGMRDQMLADEVISYRVNGNDARATDTGTFTAMYFNRIATTNEKTVQDYLLATSRFGTKLEILN